MPIGNILQEKNFSKPNNLLTQVSLCIRKRLKEDSLELILSQSLALHPKAKNEKEVQIETTVQEKNITFPTDDKLAKKVIDNWYLLNILIGI